MVESPEIEGLLLRSPFDFDVRLAVHTTDYWPLDNHRTTSTGVATGFVYYRVAYPHPSDPKNLRIERIKPYSDVDGKTLYGLHKSIYPEHSSDLESATLCKASRSTGA